MKTKAAGTVAAPARSEAPAKGNMKPAGRPAGRASQRRTPPPRPVGPKTLTGSREAKRQAAVLLEVLGGERGPQEASAALGVSLTRYYLLETRGLQGLIQALEPRPRGKQKSPETRLAELARDNQRLRREVGRCQTLVRAAQRSLGLPPSATTDTRRRLEGKRNKKAGKRKVKRRRMVRGAKVVAALRQEEPATSSAAPGQEASSWAPDVPHKG